MVLNDILYKYGTMTYHQAVYPRITIAGQGRIPSGLVLPILRGEKDGYYDT